MDAPIRILICVCILAAVSVDAQCARPSQEITFPVNVPATALTLALSVPNSVKVQTIAGTSWGVTVHQDTNKVGVKLAYNSNLNIISGQVTTGNPNAGVSSATFSSVLIFGLSFLSCLFLMKSNMDTRLLLFIMGISMIPFVLSQSVDCTNGTIVITYPPSGVVTINGRSVHDCSDAFGYFNISLCPTTAAPSTTAHPLTTAKPLSTTAKPLSTTAKPLSTTAQPLSTTAQPLSTTAQPLSTTAQPLSTTAQPSSTTAATTTPSSCTIPIGSQCWGKPGSGSACGTTGCCPGCCASGQCGGLGGQDNEYWIGCRAAGTAGGPANNTCIPGYTPPPSTPPPTRGAIGLFCPSANDLVVSYGSPTLANQGWTIVGGGGVGTKAAFNVLGGWVSYTVNWAGVPTGVNANIYSISPNFNGASAFSQSLYCDGQPASGTKPWCVEIDWIETNGNCGGATALHTINQQDNTGGCGAWGCAANFFYNGVTTFTMNVSYATTGEMTVRWNGNLLGNLNPAAGANDWSGLYNAYTSQGAVIYSSQWTGWVPDVSGACSTAGGNLGVATMSISNLKIYGSVVQGPTPTSC